ncbi:MULTISPECIES: diguanylate cyclase [unclassified Ketobacter]|uniref:sensor domain-containing diguanylate cyclase n=1 Tax=unclassified Ketobacter TaxID=2639109 RepID=UPI000F255E50|nr:MULTISPECIES: diguanylate cyclase [unclassified Ketobacter]RLT87917.1 MAG: GGDEF domain-containing protein [Ketobacter sp. GenoA1]RLT96718.1 MAG: GGDEF domain-containing protein [Ketobacter sp.]
MILKLIVAVLLIFPQFALAVNVIDVGGQETGTKTTGQQEILHDVDGDLDIAAAASISERGAFQPLQSAGSTGLKPGAFWSHFALRNVTDEAITLDLEYVDHQLIALEAYTRNLDSGDDYRNIARMSLADPFSERPVVHNRFVVRVTIPARQVKEFLIKFSSHQAGFVFPSMRIWNPDRLREVHTTEVGIIMFLFGGIFLMAIISLVGALATQDRTFLIYAVYALSKIVSWCTILGYTHQFFIKEGFHWNYLSVSGAFGVLAGTVFARAFLQTQKYTPRIDYVLIFMMLNAVFLLFCALFNLTGLAVLSITVALLLYPMMSVAGVVRWRQGSTDAAVFALAWSLLVVGLVVQALRDLGLVEHSIMNYYWPAFASFVEMLGIMAAMGIKVRRLRLQKDQAEHRYTEQLEMSKAELEAQVVARTRELEQAKLAAEHEARTDPLTGVYNRRSFFIEAGKRMNLALRKHQPLSIMMFDIDHFKSVNDTFGHSIGDEALRVFSDSVVQNLRDSDVWGRLGGEEFALVLSEDREGTLQTAQRLRQAIGQIVINTPSGELRMTASIGVAYLQSDHNIELLLNKADDALYKAKNQGRDQIVEYSEAL